MLKYPIETMSAAGERWTEVISRLPSHREETIALCRAFPNSRTLLETNPALALCIACAHTWDTLDDRSPVVFETLLGSTRRKACCLLGFPETEASVRILGRILPEACSIPLLMRLRHSLRQNGLPEILRHVPQIDHGALVLAAFWEAGNYGTARLFTEMAAEVTGEELPPSYALLKKSWERDSQGGPTFPKPGSIAKLRRRNSVSLDSVVDRQFPDPPFAGNEHIVPLHTPRLLKEEGKRQQNCVAKYDCVVRNGGLYFYRVIEPERATLALDQCASGWAIWDLLGAQNNRVCDETFYEIQAWLNHAQLGVVVEPGKRIVVHVKRDLYSLAGEADEMNTLLCKHSVRRGWKPQLPTMGIALNAFAGQCRTAAKNLVNLRPDGLGPEEVFESVMEKCGQLVEWLGGTMGLR